MCDFSYVLTEDFVGIFCLNNPLLNFDFFQKDLCECCRDAEMCVINLFVKPSPSIICRILLFYEDFCEKKQHNLKIFCANNDIFNFLKKFKVDLLIKEVEVM